MKPTEQVSQLISNLTKDEDQRQELWAHYLSGNAPSSLASYLHEITEKFTLDTELQSYLWHIVKHPPSEKFQELLSRLSPLEQSIVTLLALGLTAAQISIYKGISEVRVKQVMQVVRYNSVWSDLYGIDSETT